MNNEFWTMIHYKNRVAELEKENEKLKKENDELKKENEKLKQNQKKT